ncbi:unnamed protein product [Porites lobata]|uniref:TNFR-Cys domain-containing protein n=1 Tax=Porites lobata TaxID=104759 RepID=A0ABN8QXF0_9CNID|nr:unnamed protein product [Porites lobata]
MNKFCLFVIVLGLGAPMLATASNDCPPLQYYNGTSCTTCSKCPRGFGVKTKCTALKDTECQDCIAGYDYSGTNDMTQCIKCNEGSNCPDGNFKVISKCTIYSPTVCSGCKEGSYFDKGTGLDGGCVECSKCAIGEVETQKCSTAHDRKCQKMPSTTSELWVPSTAGPTNITKTPRSVPSSTTIDWTKTSKTEISEPEERPSVSQILVWGLLSGVLAVLVIALAVAVLLCWNRSRSRRTRKKDKESNGFAHQSTPLMQQRGLDTLISNITTLDRKFITMQLNKKDTHGYHYWKYFTDYLGLRDESQNWEQSENPGEKFLEAFSEKEHSTIGKLIEASEKTAGLPLFVNELKNRFSEANQSGRVENLAPNGSTWV